MNGPSSIEMRREEIIGGQTFYFLPFCYICGEKEEWECDADKTAWIDPWMMCVECVNCITNHL